MRAGLLVTSLLLVGTSLPAQRIGDNLRVWVAGGDEWQHGILIDRDSARLHVRHRSGEMVYRFTEIERAEVWGRKNVGVEVMKGALAVIAGWMAAAVVTNDGQPATGNWGQDLGLAAAIGAVAGGIHVARYPRCWRRLRA